MRLGPARATCHYFSITAKIQSVEIRCRRRCFRLALYCRRRTLLDSSAPTATFYQAACALRPLKLHHCLFYFLESSLRILYALTLLHCASYWVGSDLKTTNPASGEAEKGCLYYPQPPPGHVLYPSRKTYGKQKFIELEKLHHCTFVSGDFQEGGDITFVLNMLVTQRVAINFRCMVRDVNVAQKSVFPVANKRNELIVSKRPYQQCEECEEPLDTPIQYCSCCGAARCSGCMASVCRIPRYVPVW